MTMRRNSTQRSTSLLCALLTALIMLFAGPAFPIDLIESYKLAVENSSELAAAKIESQAGELNLDITKAISVFPTVTIGAMSERKNKFVGADTRIDRANVTLSQTLWRESLGAGLKFSEQQEILAGLIYKKAQINLFKQVVDAYFNVLAAQDTLETNRSEITSIRVLLDHAVVRRDAGVGTETDVRIAESRLALANAGVIMAETTVENAILALSELIGHRATDIDQLNENAPTPSMKSGQVEDWTELALKNNIDLEIQQVQVKIAERSIQLATSDYDFAAHLNVRVNDKLGGTESLMDHSVASITISKSFSTAGAESRLKKQATLQYEAELQRLKALRTRTATLTSSTFRSAASLIEQIDALEVAVNAVQSSYDLTQSNYDVGLVTSLEVLDAQQDLFEARRALLEARYAYLRSLIALELVAGTLDLSDLQALNNLLL